MAGLAHDVLIQALRDDGGLLPMLMQKLTGETLPHPLKNEDSTVRFTRAAEVRPDVVYRIGRGWLACEVQNKLDETKARSWLMAVAALRFHHRRMGDLVVITTSRSVARWAERVAHERGPAGTTCRLTPVVLWLDLRRARELLDPDKPELALCAAWAMKSRYGRAAARIVGRAFDLCEKLPPPLRDAQRHAIYNVLSDRLRSQLREAVMHPDRVPETPEARKLRLFIESIGEKRGLAEGKRDTLKMILKERGFSLSAAERSRIDACSEVAQLDVWLKRALTAGSVGEALVADGVQSASRRTRSAPPRSPRVKSRPRT